ncbi:hypothetical protein CPB83DRAFT_881773 [Crepidotus variabilis]|uniref:Uncharacterized protein n=1 Tax=Crepidotus variabilis TaxID=179855 RepID=A0A9P6EL85_9AGAR|nr:hypothetical protein CPB83DRAFT_881773 [Crepidotus variabilis]
MTIARHSRLRIVKVIIGAKEITHGEVKRAWAREELNQDNVTILHSPLVILMVVAGGIVVVASIIFAAICFGFKQRQRKLTSNNKRRRTSLTFTDQEAESSSRSCSVIDLTGPEPDGTANAPIPLDAAIEVSNGQSSTPHSMIEVVSPSPSEAEPSHIPVPILPTLPVVKPESENLEEIVQQGTFLQLEGRQRNERTQESAPGEPEQDLPPPYSED